MEAVVQEAPETAENDDGGNKDGRGKHGKQAGREIPPEILTVYRHVAKKKASADKTELQRTVRAIKEKTPERFLDRLGKLEVEWTAAKTAMRNPPQEEAGAGKPDGEMVEDVPSEKCLVMIRGWLKEKGWEDAGTEADNGGGAEDRGAAVGSEVAGDGDELPAERDVTGVAAGPV
jgi:hypothetical protein